LLVLYYATDRSSMDKPQHRFVQLPSSRLSTHDLGRIGVRKHHVAGLLEVDVTEARERVELERRRGRHISFFAWAVKTIADCVAKDGLAHAMRSRKNEVIVFSDVDISTVVEKRVRGQRVPLPVLIREANRKNVDAIYDEVRAAMGRSVRDEHDHVLSKHQSPAWLMKLFYALPQWVRICIFERILSKPFRAKRAMGTVVVTSLESVSHSPGWIIPRSMHNLCFALGSVTRKPWVVGNQVVVREILHLTVLVNHDVIDGAPAARFLDRLVGELQLQGGGTQAQSAELSSNHGETGTDAT
jgi:pyruvate/2-oxoglutarate dehydrogenase complex dihydrolipoamide acyltransferase (E2) component